MTVIVVGNDIEVVQSNVNLVFGKMKISKDNKINIVIIDGFKIEHAPNSTTFRTNMVPAFNCVKPAVSIKISCFPGNQNIDNMNYLLAHNDYFDVSKNVKIIWDMMAVDKPNIKSSEKYN